MSETHKLYVLYLGNYWLGANITRDKWQFLLFLLTVVRVDVAQLIKTER